RFPSSLTCLPPRCAPPRRPSSFPTRRSSDLPGREALTPLLLTGSHDQELLAEYFADQISASARLARETEEGPDPGEVARGLVARDRKSTRLNSSHVSSSYAVFCLKKNSVRIC